MMERFAFAMAFSLLAATGLMRNDSVAARQAAPIAQPPTPLRGTGETRTQLPDGRWLLTGGQDGNTPGSRLAVYDPATNTTFVLPARLNEPRAWHAATVLPDGAVLIVGGVTVGGQSTATAERFDPATETVTIVQMSGAGARAGHTATLLTDGRVLVVGGETDAGVPNALAELWDVQNGTSTRVPGVHRTGHSATLLADGRVLLTGGQDSSGQSVAELAVFDPAANRIEPLTAALPSDGGIPIVMDTRPANGATDVPLETRLTIRLSHAVRPETASDQTVVLTGPDGPVSTHTIAAERGQLLFVWPLNPLAPETTYTLTLVGLRDATGVPLVVAPLTFTTAKGARTTDTADAEPWVPDPISGDWQTHRPPSPWQTLPALHAEPGVTALAGQVLTLDGRPLPDVTLEIDRDSTRTDRTGRFLLRLPSAGPGHHELGIDGKTASRPNKVYGFFEYGLTLAVGDTTVLPFTIWMPRLDMAHQVTLSSPTTTEVMVTTPNIPGLELHLPPQTVIRGEDGQTVKQVGITPIPVDRPPFPLARNVEVPVYFTVQPGSAYVNTGGSGPKGAWLVYPNYTHQYVGKRTQFFHYDPDDKGWFVYGLGTVTASGAQVMPDPTTRIYEFTGAMISSNPSPPPVGPPPGDCCANDGDPVNLATGLFMQEATDLFVPDVLPISLTRTYRTRDLDARPFGIGTTHPYEMFLWSVHNWTQADLVLPDGARIHYVRTSAGSSWSDAVYSHEERPNDTPPTSATPTPFYKSTFAWNGNGWDLRLKDGTVYVFGENTPLQAIRDRYGNTIRLTRTSGQSGNITRVTSPNGRWIAFTYDGSNRITQASDNIGRSVTYTYDANGNLTSVTDPENHVTSYTYDSAHRMLTVRPPNLQGTSTDLVTNTYDITAGSPTLGWVTRQTHVDGGVYLFTYSVVNGTSTQTDVRNPRGYTRRVTFNGDGYTLSDTNALGEANQQVTSVVRPTRSNFVTSATNAHGDQTATTYDDRGNALTVTQLAGTPDAVTTTYTYDTTFNQVLTITDPLNHTTTFAYDGNGNPTSITDALNHSAIYTYNAAGQVTSATDPLQHSTQYGYDKGDLITITDPLGRITRRFVDAGGRVVAQTDPAGQMTRMAYDRLNQVTTVTDPLGQVTTYTYDTAGRLATITDALNHQTTYGYDALDRLTSRTDPLGKTEAVTYDENGNLSRHADRRGQVTARSYDSLNRLKQITYSDNSTITYTYDAGNRLTVVEDSVNGTIMRTFDSLDRLTAETTSQGTISYTHDKAGRRATMTVAGQPTVTYGYDDANRLTSVTQGSSIVTVTYDDTNHRSTLTLPNGIVTTYGYDDANELTGITYSFGQTTFGTLTYTYDVAGRRTQVSGSWARTGLPRAVSGAAYDAANRLTQWAGAALSYDANGNLSSDGLTTYVWNAREQLAGLAGELNASFVYDPTGRRHARTVAGETRTFLYDGNNAVQELSAGGTPTANILAGLTLDDIFERVDSLGMGVFLRDAVGSIVALTDSSGNIPTSFVYDPFGGTYVAGVATENALGFMGRERDYNSLYFAHARYYNPGEGRFLSEDPIGFLTDVNFYRYAFDNPILYSDPSGLSPLGQTTSCIGPGKPPCRPYYHRDVFVSCFFAQVTDPQVLGELVGCVGLGGMLGPIAGGIAGGACGGLIGFYTSRQCRQCSTFCDERGPGPCPAGNGPSLGPVPTPVPPPGRLPIRPLR